MQLKKSIPFNIKLILKYDVKPEYKHQKVRCTLFRITSKMLIPNVILKLLKNKGKENLESSKRQVNYHIYRSSIIHLIGNFGSHTQNTKK